MLGHMSAVTTLDIYTHITDDMQCAVASIDRGNRQGRTAGRSGAREECEKKLKALIVEMKAEIAEAPRPMDLGKGNGRPPEEKKGKRGKKK